MLTLIDIKIRSCGIGFATCAPACCSPWEFQDHFEVVCAKTPHSVTEVANHLAQDIRQFPIRRKNHGSHHH